MKDNISTTFCPSDNVHTDLYMFFPLLPSLLLTLNSNEKLSINNKLEYPIFITEHPFNHILVKKVFPPSKSPYFLCTFRFLWKHNGSFHIDLSIRNLGFHYNFTDVPFVSIETQYLLLSYFSLK